MNNKEIIDNIILSLDSADQAVPSKAFLKRMEQAAQKFHFTSNTISNNTLIGIAASFLLLAMANFYVISEHDSSALIFDESSVQNYELVPTKKLYYE